MMKNKKIIFASGGTGGHIFPAISLLDYFKKKGYDTKIVTDLRGEKYLKSNPQINFFILNTETPFNKSFFKKNYSYIKIFISIIKSLFYLLKEKPNLVFGLGGYVSFPLCIAAKILNIPLIIYENNIILGKTNIFLLPFAKKVMLAMESVNNLPLKYRNKIYTVGHIIRDQILDYLKEEKKQNDFFTIVILGGSQGAQILGLFVPKVIKRLSKLGYKIKVHHQCVKQQKDSLENFYIHNKIENNVFNFSENIAEYMYKSDIAITRSGASSTAELIHIGTPFIAIPYPHATDNHQFLNAKHYVNKGYCWMLEQKDLSEENLYNLVLKIFKDKQRLLSIRNNMKKNININVNKNINNLIEEFL
jgi:UDP-N-acetylglucosamine--N-acetylmuramyl-(pentapeptide) pyrophosphoryl-undecaprenol N-acetylglucosamine transferase